MIFNKTIFCTAIHQRFARYIDKNIENDTYRRQRSFFWKSYIWKNIFYLKHNIKTNTKIYCQFPKLNYKKINLDNLNVKSKQIIRVQRSDMHLRKKYWILLSYKWKQMKTKETYYSIIIIYYSIIIIVIIVCLLLK